MATRATVTFAWHAKNGDVVAMTALSDAKARVAVPEGATSMSVIGMSAETDDLYITLDPAGKPTRMSFRWP